MNERYIIEALADHEWTEITRHWDHAAACRLAQGIAVGTHPATPIARRKAEGRIERVRVLNNRQAHASPYRVSRQYSAA